MISLCTVWQVRVYTSNIQVGRCSSTPFDDVISTKYRDSETRAKPRRSNAKSSNLFIITSGFFFQFSAIESATVGVSNSKTKSRFSLSRRIAGY